MYKCLISVITICWNITDTIENTMRSVEKQTLTDYEHIVIDGASTDGTWEKIKKYSYAQLVASSEPDNGISDAFNKGIKKAHGKYLIFLNGGDYFTEAYVLLHAAKKLAVLDDDIVTFSIENIASDQHPISEEVGEKLWQQSLIPHQSTFIKKSVFSDVGLYNPSFRVRMDYEFFKRCYKHLCSFKCIPQVISHYDSNGISGSDTYLFDKEGLAVNLIYNETVKEDDCSKFRSLCNHDQVTGEIVGHIENRLELECANNKKIMKLYHLMLEWVRLLYTGKSVDAYFKTRGYSKIAIYGYFQPAILLKNALQGSDVEIAYYVDKVVEHIPPVENAYGWSDDWPEADCMVVTPLFAYESIKREIRCNNKFVGDIVSIEDVIAQSKYD